MVPVGTAMITISLHLGARQLSRQDVCEMLCRWAHRGQLWASARGQRHQTWGFPLPLQQSWVLLCPIFEEGGKLLHASLLILAHHTLELPSQTYPVLGSDQYIPGPSTKPGHPGVLSVMWSGETEPLRFVARGRVVWVQSSFPPATLPAYSAQGSATWGQLWGPVCSRLLF